MKIVSATVGLYRFQSRIPLIDKPAGEPQRVICEIETDAGHTGFGVTFGFLAHGVIATLQVHLLPAIRDLDLSRLEAVHDRLWKVITLRGIARGTGLMALSCLDMAIWDALGKASGQSVAQMFGGAREDAEVYVTYGFGDYNEDQLIELARKLQGEGFRTLKNLVGVTKGGVAEDAQRVRAVRKAIDHSVTLALDANESLTFDQALRLCSLLGDIDLAWFEEPIRGGNARELRDLRLMGRVPIALGQFDGSVDRFREWIDAGAVDIFIPNSMFNGGFSETRRVAALSQAWGKPLSDAGGGGIMSLHHVAGFRNGSMTEMHLGVGNVERQLFLDSPEPVRGRLAVPKAPGIGLTLNRDMLRDCKVKIDS
jgi:L-rhamnonate dehydratase